MLPVSLAAFLELNINASFLIFPDLGKLRGSKKEYEQQSSVPTGFNRLSDQSQYYINKSKKKKKREKKPETGGEMDGHDEESSNSAGEVERLPLVRSEGDERRNNDGEDEHELGRRFHFSSG